MIYGCFSCPFEEDAVSLSNMPWCLTMHIEIFVPLEIFSVFACCTYTTKSISWHEQLVKIYMHSTFMQMEKLARCQYLKKKDPKACALLYIVLNRIQVLAGLFKISKDEKDKPLVAFLSRNFQVFLKSWTLELHMLLWCNLYILYLYIRTYAS